MCILASPAPTAQTDVLPAAAACCCSDGDINQLRAEIHEVLGNRNISDEKFQAVVLDEIAALKVCVHWVIRVVTQWAAYGKPCMP